MMKKFILTLLFVMSMSTIAYADFEYVDPTVTEVEDFQITSGLTKDFESTFDKTRTITGTAAKDTTISIVVYKNIDDEYFENYIYNDNTVESFPVFTQTIDLDIGENIIQIIATNGDTKTVQNFTLKRKEGEIKRELENSILVPGKNNY